MKPLILAFGLLVALDSRAACVDIASGSITIEVASCHKVDTENLFVNSKQDVPITPADLEKLEKTYVGFIVKGKVTKSSAKAVGAKVRTQVLRGETESFFLDAKHGKKCEALTGKALRAKVSQVCCDGHFGVPCLAGTSYSIVPRK